MVYIGVGVSVGVVVLIAAGLILISVTVCLRRRSKKKKLVVTSSNVAYNATSAQLSVTNETSTEEYDYVSTHQLRPPHPDHTHKTSGGEDMTENTAYVGRREEVELSGNDAYGQNEVELRDNEAYGATATGGVREEYDYVHHYWAT